VVALLIGWCERTEYSDTPEPAYAFAGRTCASTFSGRPHRRHRVSPSPSCPRDRWPSGSISRCQVAPFRMPSSRRVVVSLDGTVLADRREPVVLFETDLPTRYDVPRADVNFDSLSPTANHSLCPYKGSADLYWDVIGHPDATNAAWSYPSPVPAVGQIRDRVAFYNERVDIAVDGIAQERPVSVFSIRANRPVSSSPRVDPFGGTGR
jgi:uncharacterized protein (DUF427 family)